MEKGDSDIIAWGILKGAIGIMVVQFVVMLFLLYVILPELL